MIIKYIELKGFRNYKHQIINLAKTNLIIGSNDVGKSNLLYALRILLDKSISDYNLEPSESDFYAYEELNEFIITIKCEDIQEECILSVMRELVSGQGEMFIQYKALKNPETGEINYKFFSGGSLSSLQELDGRKYLKVLNLKYISSYRDLSSYIKKEKKQLITNAKEKRNETEIADDKEKTEIIKNNISGISNEISSLSYISKATTAINDELRKLSLHHQNSDIGFDPGTDDVDNYISNINLVSKMNNKSLAIGGDGRNNQIFLAMWAAKNNTTSETEPSEVTIYCIEEPEVHLHPHQQRKIAEYLSNIFNGQLFITSHSPQIACQFHPASIIRLYSKNGETIAAGSGVQKNLVDIVNNLGYRMSIIPAEAFFANVVFLVEGPSEILFYTKLSKDLNIDLDRLNISILMVDGIDFKVFVDILKALEIPYVIRTDNDVFKVPKKVNTFRLAGLVRAINLTDINRTRISKGKNLLTWDGDKATCLVNSEIIKRIRNFLIKKNIFLSDVDLESDLLSSSVSSKIKEYYNTHYDLLNNQDILNKMQKRKAINMQRILESDLGLSSLEPVSSLVQPLLKVKEIAQNDI